MNIETRNANEVNIAVVSSEDILITDTQSALDLIMTVKYETGADRIVINKNALAEEFFRAKLRFSWRSSAKIYQLSR